MVSFGPCKATKVNNILNLLAIAGMTNGSSDTKKNKAHDIRDLSRYFKKKNLIGRVTYVKINKLFVAATAIEFSLGCQDA